jgi:hypothetical protein
VWTYFFWFFVYYIFFFICVSVPVDVFMHARTHARTNAHTHTRTHARTHALTHARTHAHARARTHTGGRYRSQHALQHFVDSGHSFAIELVTQRVCACFHPPFVLPPLPPSNQLSYSVKSYRVWYLRGPVVGSK